MKKLLILSLNLIFIVVNGCGVYTFNPRGKSDVTNIAIEPFANETSEFGLADRLTEQVIDAFITDGTLKIVPVDNSEAYLVGILTGYQRVPHKFDENDQVEEYKILLDVEISLKNTGDDSEKWKERLTFEGIYNASDETEEDGQVRASERLVEAVLNKTTKSW
ncbi:MAG: LptE family protein [Candidatus Zixiibacteriota bacterium]